MSKLVAGPGYSPTSTDAEIITAFIKRYGYRPPEPDTWTRTPTAIIIGDTPITPEDNDER